MYQEIPGGADGLGAPALSLHGSPKLWALSADCELMAYDASHAPARDWADPVALTLSPSEAEGFLARHGVVDAFRAALRRPDAQVSAPRYIIDGEESSPARTDEATNTAKKVGRAALRDLLTMGDPYQPTTWFVETHVGQGVATPHLVVPDWAAVGSVEDYRSPGAPVDVGVDPWLDQLRGEVQAIGVEEIASGILVESADSGLYIRPIWPEWIEQNGTVVLP